MEKYIEDPLARGMKELLSSLPEDTLKILLGTASTYLVKYGSVPLDDNGKPTMDSKTHAIQTIMMYSDPRDLLGRQKMTKTILSEYLNQKGVKMTMPATKRTLCEDVLKHWDVASEGSLPTPPAKEIKYEKPQVPSTTPTVSTSQCQSSSSSATFPNRLAQSQSVQTQSNGAQTQRNANALVTVSNQVEKMDFENDHTIALNNVSQEVRLGTQLGLEFSRWYYERLNSLADFSASHFWTECNLRLEIILAALGDNQLINEVMGNEVCCATLKDLVVVKHLYFNPNTTSGIKGYLSPHGLANVFVCGTIHLRDNEDTSPVGVFEQMFGLMKDPRFGNNYKIKFTVLRLREGGHLAVQASPPEGCDTSLVGIIEEVDDDND